VHSLHRGYTDSAHAAEPSRCERVALGADQVTGATNAVAALDGRIEAELQLADARVATKRSYALRAIKRYWNSC
jgi:hypothetical protein